MGLEELGSTLLAWGIIIVFFIMIFTKMRNQSISELFEDIRNAFRGKKDGVSGSIERYYR